MDEQNIPYSGPKKRFGKQYLSFKDPDGLQLHLVFDNRKEDLEEWSKSPVPNEHQIQGLLEHYA
ncbi:MAG: hypothetical protein U5J63_18185 [Fodinibius sp.]|nr:hypothetical protein [Fodinibius sp.]